MRRSKVSEHSKPVKKVVRVEDLATTVRLKKVQAKADAAARKLEAEAKKAQAKVELQKLRLGMSAREAAARHLANFAGLYMFLSSADPAADPATLAPNHSPFFDMYEPNLETGVRIFSQLVADYLAE